MNDYQIIDMENWKRKQHCMAFRKSMKPTVGITFEADITEFRRAVKEQGLSFTMAMVYAVSKTANEIDEFRYRFLDGQVVLFDRIDTTFTFLNKETELFKVVYVPMKDDLAEYCALASKTAAEQTDYFPQERRVDVFQCSPMPFVTYTQMSHTASSDGDRALPTFDWCKYYDIDGRTKIMVSAQVHHSFADGLHLGRFAQRLQKYFDSFERN